MRTKLFGMSGIEDDARRDLDLLAGLGPQDLDRLARWLSETRKPIPFTWSEIQELVEGTSLDGPTAERMLVVLRYILTNWRVYGLTLEEVKTDLKSLGYSQEQVEKIGGLLQKLDSVKELVYRSALKKGYEVKGLPTIDDVNIFWDLRPVFAEHAYDLEPVGSAYEDLVGHTYLMLLEIFASREDRKTESITYQLSEDDLDRLLMALKRAKRQLEIVKKKVLL